MKNVSCLVYVLLISVNVFGQLPDKIFHYSVMDAMRNGVYTGGITVQQLSGKGDFGLGTYHLLDGELIALDGQYYRVAADGSVAPAAPDRTVPFGSFTFFKQDLTFTLSGIKDVADLCTAVIKKLPSEHRFYALKVKVSFDRLTLGGAVKVDEGDTTGIAHFMKVRPLYHKQQITGTIVGFYNPYYISGSDLSLFHLHFIADDQSCGGHLVDGQLSAPVTVLLDEKDIYEIILPDHTHKGYQRKWNAPEVKSDY